jgi:hypothetical protein
MDYSAMPLYRARLWNHVLVTKLDAESKDGWEARMVAEHGPRRVSLDVIRLYTLTDAGPRRDPAEQGHAHGLQVQEHPERP